MQNVIATPVTEAMQIDFSPTKIPPDTVKPSVVAQVKFDRKLQQFFVECPVLLEAAKAFLLLPLSLSFNWVADTRSKEG